MRKINPSKKSDVAVMAIVIAALMVSTSVLPILSTLNYSIANPDYSNEYKQVITYCPGDGSGTEYVGTYYGVASTEYNPVFWDVKDDSGQSIVWTAPTGTATYYVDWDFNTSSGFGERNWYISFHVNYNKESIDSTIHSILSWNDPNGDYDDPTINGNDVHIHRHGGVWKEGASGTVRISVSLEIQKVFAGWKDYSGNIYAPGEVVPSDVGKLTAIWKFPDAYLVNDPSNFIEGLDGSFEIEFDLQGYREYGDGRQNANIPESSTESSEYTRITYVNSDQSISGSLTTGTYRSQGGPYTFSFTDQTTLNGPVIIDNLNLRASEVTSNTHGGTGEKALFANGHRLIIGTKVGTGSLTSHSQALTVFGGGSGNDSNIASTEVIIHSGVYYNVVAGSLLGTVGDTNLTIRGGTVLDTVVGGNGSNYHNGNNIIDYDWRGNPVYEYYTNIITGSTNVWLLHDAYLPGDTYEETKLGTNRIPSGITLYESTIVTGGSNNGIIQGSTNVYISDGAEVWDVQGAGRRGLSSVDSTAHVRVSGDALVKHLVCGSITDGNNGTTSDGSSENGTSSVKSTYVSVTDGAIVGSVFGAGYDTYYQSNHSSMFDSDGTITVEISGHCIVGYVYGGGYRGAVGSDDSPIQSVSVNISGGTVKGDVFGGGRGGLDKILHNSDGTFYSGQAYTDSTGDSRVYAKSVSVTVSGGTVNGSVYGGGESVPVISSYGSITPNGAGRQEVAAVYANQINVSVSGGTVNGNVFGGGKGVDMDDVVSVDDVERHSTAYIFAIDSSGSIYRIPWVSGAGIAYPNNYNYGGYALLTGIGSNIATISVRISSDTQPTNVNGSVYGGGRGDADSEEIANVMGEINISVNAVGKTESEVIVGNGEDAIFGGGMYAATIGSVSISLDGSTINGSIYGGGMGDTESTSLGSLTTYSETEPTGLVSIIIQSNSTVQGNVFGGGKLGTLNTYEITIRSTNSEVKEAIFGGGMGKTGDTSFARVNAQVISVTIIDSTVGTDGATYSLFGGGAAAYTDAEEIRIRLLEGTIMNGDVHGGGYGTVPGGTEATNPSETKPIMSPNQREILLNGATVYGSLYGGSRAGNDETTNDESQNGRVTLYLEAGVVMQGIFGGGFLGESYMDSVILIGSSAVEETGILPQASVDGNPDLRLNNVYGGGNLNIPGEGDIGENVLLHGNTEIRLSGGPITSVNFLGYHMPGPGEESDVSKLSIYGDIYGEGNYSDVSGNSNIFIYDYKQDNLFYIKSIQRADYVTISSSSIIVEGSADSGETGVSVLVSLNDIGNLTIENGTTLGLQAQTSGIGEYHSIVRDRQMTESDYLEGDEEYWNEVILYGGRVLRILGENDTGLDSDNSKTGRIYGYTLLSRPSGDTYHGAFAIGSYTTVDDSGFVIMGSNGIEAASYLPDSNEITKTWYIAGHISIGMILEFGTEGSNGQRWSSSGEATLPQLSNGSMLAYAASYVNPTVQDGVYILTKGDYESYISQNGFDAGSDIDYRDFFSMSVSGTEKDDDSKIHSVEVKTHSWKDGNLERYYFDSYSAMGVPNDFTVKITGDLASSEYYGLVDQDILGTSGIVGSVTIHLAEVIEYTVNGTKEYLPVNMIDINVTLNVLPKSGGEVQIPITIMTSVSNGRYTGTGYVVFPSKGSKHTYTISTVGTTENRNPLYDDIKFVADSTYLSSLGWVSSPYIQKGLDGESIDTDGIRFGEGGIKDSVMRVEYDGETGSGSMTFEVEASVGTETTTYVVTINLKVSNPVNLILKYTSVGEDGLTYIMNILNDPNTDGYYRIGWSTDDENIILPVQYDSVLQNTPISFQIEGETAVHDNSTIGEMMDALIRSIEDEMYGDVEFDYAEHLDGWYVKDTLKYDMGSVLKESLTLTARFGIEVRFHGDGVTINPTSVIITPGTSLHDNGFGNPGDGDIYPKKPWDGTGSRTGYHLVDINNEKRWVITTGVTTADEHEPFDFDAKQYVSIDLYLPWIPDSYEFTMSVIGGNPESILEAVGIFGGTWNENNGTYTFSGATVLYGTDITVSTTTDSGYRISAASLSANGGDRSELLAGVPGPSLWFSVPNAGENGIISLTVTITHGVAVTVEYKIEEGLSNGLGSAYAYFKFDDHTLSFTGDAGITRGTVIQVSEGKTMLEVTVPTDYWIAIWNDDQLITNGRENENLHFTIDAMSDVSLSFSVYKEVHLSEIGIGIDDVTYIAKDVYGDDQGSESKISVGTTPFFVGYTLYVTAEQNYSLPSYQTGTDTAVIVDGRTTYDVLGTVDIVLTAIPDSVTIAVSVTFLKDGIVLNTNQLSGLIGKTLSYSFRGIVGNITLDSDMLVSANLKFVIVVQMDNGDEQLAVSMQGFHTGTANVVSDSDKTVNIELKLIEYRIDYRNLNENIIGSEEWDILQESVPEFGTGHTVVNLNGEQVWLGKADLDYSIVTSLNPSIFDQTGHNLDLYALPPISGDMPIIKELDIVATQSQLSSGFSIDLGMDDFSIGIVGEGVTMTYDASEKIFKMEGAGTGVFHIIHMGTSLTVVSLPDLHGGSEAV